MRVWLLKAGEPLPTDEGLIRLHRVGLLANFLAQRGHDVTWWTSTFDHYGKRQRASCDTRVRLPNGVELVMLHGCGYKKNVSLSRIREHRLVARRFAQLAQDEARPDVILSAYPTLELSVAATRYGRAHGVPVIVDIRDLWPDLILDVVPDWARSLGRFAMSFMWRQAKEACGDATAISGTSDRFVEWGLSQSGREKGPLDRYFPLGYVTTPPAPQSLERGWQYWEKLGIRRDDNVFTVCFFGGMGQQCCLGTVISAARILEQRGCNLRFVLCGSGEHLNSLRGQASDLKSVTMPGWVEAPHIWTLMRMSHIGLAPYFDKPTFSSNFTNKTIEYLSAGLPVVASLHGDFEQFLVEANCGVSYPAQDPVALADILANLESDRALLSEMARGAASVFRQRFVAEQVYETMCEYLEMVAAGTSNPQGRCLESICMPVRLRSNGDDDDPIAQNTASVPRVVKRETPCLKVWLIKVGEPLPTDPDPGRPYRMGMVASELCGRGHDVTWWSSTFNHATKQYRDAGPKEEILSERFRIIQLHGCAYEKHVSLARLRNHRQEAREFARAARMQTKPDLIVCSYPTIDLSMKAVRYGSAHDIPVVLDIRDLWPDTFLDLVSAPLRPLGRAALAGLFRGKAYAFRNATAVIGTSESFVDWGVAAASRRRRDLDRAFTLGYPQAKFTREQLARANEFWMNQFGGSFPRCIICFFGNFSEHVLDLRTVVNAARALEAMGETVTFVLCGTGPSRASVGEVATGLRSVILPGRVDAAQIRVLMEHAKAGLVPYEPRWDFVNNIPNKAIEYLSAGLPVITCLKGELEQLILRHDCGAFYESGNSAALALAVVALVADEQRHAMQHAAAQTLFDMAFDAARVYADYANHLEEIVRVGSR